MQLELKNKFEILEIYEKKKMIIIENYFFYIFLDKK